MRTLSFTLCFLVSWMGAFSMAAPKYPVVREIQGNVRWTNKDNHEVKLKLKSVLIEQAVLEISDKSQVVIQMDAQRSMRIFSNSRVELPSISWETGEAPLVVIKRGTLRWQEEVGKTYNIALTSELFSFISPVGDVVLHYDPKAAVAGVKVIKGTMEFSAMNAEDSVSVTAGQKVQFQGVRENDEIVYDILLKGKKIPRGKLGEVQSQTPDEKRLYSEVERKKQLAMKEKKEAAERKAQEKPKDKSEICSEPGGKLNQCVWLCENNPKGEKKACRLERPEVQCLRKRCNANGEWAEATEIPKEKATSLCGAQPAVKVCDY